MKVFRILALTDIHGNIKATSALIDHLKTQDVNFDLMIISGDLPATTPLSVMAQYMLKHPLSALSKTKYTHWVYKGTGRKKFVSKQISSIKDILGLLSTLNVPIIYIPGNVESLEAVAYISNWNKSKVHILGSEPYIEGEVQFIGVGGAIVPPFYSEPLCDHEYERMVYEKKWDRSLDSILPSINKISKKANILVTHEPPYFEVEFNDGKIIQGGSQKVSEIIDLIKPEIVIFGHYHEFSLSIKVGEVTYVNPGPLACYYYSTIEFTPEKAQVFLNKLPSAKFDSINKIYSKRTAKNVLYRSLRFV